MKLHQYIYWIVPELVEKLLNDLGKILDIPIDLNKIKEGYLNNGIPKNSGLTPFIFNNKNALFLDPGVEVTIGITEEDKYEPLIIRVDEFRALDIINYFKQKK